MVECLLDLIGRHGVPNNIIHDSTDNDKPKVSGTSTTNTRTVLVVLSPRLGVDVW